MWKDIKHAPKIEGRPLWVRGQNEGRKNNGFHYCWVYWENDNFYEGFEPYDKSPVPYITHYWEEK